MGLGDGGFHCYMVTRLGFVVNLGGFVAVFLLGL